MSDAIDIQTPTDILRHIAECRSTIDRWGYFLEPTPWIVLGVIIAVWLLLMALCFWRSARAHEAMEARNADLAAQGEIPPLPYGAYFDDGTQTPAWDEARAARVAWRDEYGRLVSERDQAGRDEDEWDNSFASLVVCGGIVIGIIAVATVLLWWHVHTADVEMDIWSELYRSTFGPLPEGWR